MADKPDQLDEILERGLRAYSDAEPLAGLEERVLNRVATVRLGRSGFVWQSAAVTGLAALLICVVVGVRLERRSGETVAQWHAPAAPHRDMLPARAEPQREPALAVRRVRRLERLPKRRQFPTLTPLTGEERVLLALAEQHGTEAQKILADLQERSSQPIVIPPLEIAPIQEDNR